MPSYYPVRKAAPRLVDCRDRARFYHQRQRDDHNRYRRRPEHHHQSAADTRPEQYNGCRAQKRGGYVAQSGIVVAQVSTGVYVAVTQTCSHEPRQNVIFNKTEFYCTVHGTRFDLTGKGKNSFGSRGIAVYNVATDGKTLVVYS